MTKFSPAFHCVTMCLLVLGLLEPLAVAQQPPATRLVIDHAPFTRVQRRGAPLVIEARITSPVGIRKAAVFSVPLVEVILRRYRWKPLRRAGMSQWCLIG